VKRVKSLRAKIKNDIEYHARQQRNDKHHYLFLKPYFLRS